MDNLPSHIAFIVDGNRRWARKYGLPILRGHQRELDVIKQVIGWCLKRSIKILTFYVFSTENWKRSPQEVGYLMNELFAENLFKKDVKNFHKSKIKILVSGKRNGLPKILEERIRKAEHLTRNNKKGIVVFALNYGGRSEIVDAVKKIIKKKIPLKKIDEGLIKKNLYTPNIPYPDLFIRTSEQRLSNFLLWQSAYSELYFIKKYWPDFNEKDLNKALKEFSRRKRRHGR